MARDQEPRRRGAHQLPPGRHGLSRSFVEKNQRQRILDAVADVASLAGYQAMSVEDIVGAAGVSRRTFYDNFRDKEDAFLDAFDTMSVELVEAVRAGYDSSSSFPEGVITCLRTFLEFVAAHPAYADALFVEVLAAGPSALQRRDALMTALAELLHEGAQTMPGGIRPPRLTAETVVGGIYEIVYARVLQGRTAELPDLLPDLAYSMMLPYLCHANAEGAIAQLRGSDGDAPTPAAEQETDDELASGVIAPGV